MLTRAQWTVVAYFVQQGSEAFSKNPLSRETYIGILKAFDAAHQLRAKPSSADEYYLGNLPSDCRPERSKPSDPVTPELVRKTVAETVRRLATRRRSGRRTLAARNLYGLLDDEKLAGAAALNEALAPYWPVLWRVAARGHYFERRQPVRERRAAGADVSARDSAAQGGRLHALACTRDWARLRRAAELSGSARADVSAGAVPDDRGVPGDARRLGAEDPDRRSAGTASSFTAT